MNDTDTVSHRDFSVAADALETAGESLQRMRRHHAAMAAALAGTHARLYRESGYAEASMDDPARDDTQFPNIPMDVEDLFDLIDDLAQLLNEDPAHARGDGERGHAPVSFLEIGCGPGRNLDIVAAAGVLELSRIHGFDIAPTDIAYAREVLHLGDRVELADAMDYNYSGWDVILFYRPFSDTPAEIEFEKRLIAGMDPGAWILAPIDCWLDDAPELECPHLFRQIYRKRRPACGTAPDAQVRE